MHSLIIRLISQVVRLKVELHIITEIASPDFKEGCLYTLRELEAEIKKREDETQ